MQSSAAESALQPLLVATSGWDPEGVEWYVTELACLADSEALATAVRAIARSWKSNRRPPLASILEAYHQESRRVAAETSSEAEEQCEVCDGTGAVECTDDRRHASWCTHRGPVHVEGDCNCHAVVPCGACS